jgi:hypothetical protein
MILKRSWLFRSFLLLAAFCGPIAGAAHGAYAQKASVSDVRAKISVDHAALSGSILIVAIFSSEAPDTANVDCLSGYRDLHYVLRDSSGRVISVNPDAWKTPDQVNSYGNAPCETVKSRQRESRVLLSSLYPGLSPGTYTLQITLAPRGRSGRAAFRPILVDVH